MDHSRARSSYSLKGFLSAVSVIRRTGCFYAVLFCFVPGGLLADEVVLINGDRITGVVVKETETVLTIDTEAMGTIDIKSAHIDRRASALPLAQNRKVNLPAKMKISAGKEKSQPVTTQTGAILRQRSFP